MMVASISETTTNQTRKHPLLSSEKDHVDITFNNSTRPKSRHISSKYPSPLPSPSTSSNFKSLSVDTPTSSRRSTTPLASRNSTTPDAKRSVSADRRTPTKPEFNLKSNIAGGDVSAASKLLVTSSRSWSVSFQGGAVSPPINKTKTTPNLNIVRKRIPDRKITGTALMENTKPMDQHRWPCKTRQATNTFLSKSLSLHHYMNVEDRKPSIDGGGRSTPDLGDAARSGSKELSPESRLSSMRPRSQRVLMASSMESSPMRGIMSPIRSFGTFTSETPSVLSFTVEGRRRKVGENRIVDAHLLRLLYNRQLQWRFLNARSEDILLKRRNRTEKYLWTTWFTTSDLHESVTKKRHRLQLLRQKLKLASILEKQMGFLQNWVSLDKDHSRSLLGAIEAFKGSTLRLPLDGGVTADLQNMKDAISSAMVVIQAIGSSIGSLCLKAEEVNSMVKELTNVTEKERTLIRICKDSLSMLMTLKVKDCSLRTHMLQRILCDGVIKLSNMHGSCVDEEHTLTRLSTHL